MQVKVIPMSGCMMFFLGVLTLGIAPLAIKLKERSWPKEVDEEGLVTRAGVRIPWGEFTQATRVISNVRGTVTERYDLVWPGGKVSIVPSRLEESSKVLQYIWDRLPDRAVNFQS